MNIVSFYDVLYGSLFFSKNSFHCLSITFVPLTQPETDDST